jgi:hypothetical protein
MIMWWIVLLLASTAHAQSEESAREWLVEYNAQAQEVYYTSNEGAWAYQTNITSHNQQVSVSLTSTK